MTNISSTQIQSIMSNHFHENIVSIHQITNKGIVNDVFIVKLSNIEVVVRMNSDLKALETFQKEKWCIEKAAVTGIPGPRVLAVGSIQDAAYMIENLLPGENGQDCPAHAVVQWTTLGKYAKLIHSITTSGYGEILTSPANGEFHAPLHPGFDGTWTGYVNYNINSLTEDDRLIKLGILDIASSHQVRELFCELLLKEFQFGLIHGDLSLKNLLIDDINSIFLLDWGSAEVHIVPHWEFVQLLKGQIENNEPSRLDFTAFLNGYGMNLQDFERIKKDLYSLLLLDALDKVRWALDCNQARFPSLANYAKKVVMRFI